MTVPARPSEVRRVRSELAELGRGLDLDRVALADLQTAATEACMNAARHAYPGGDGTIEVIADAVDDGIELTIRDHGEGIRPRVAAGDETGRLGLLLIVALAESVEICSRHGRGTKLSMLIPKRPQLH